MAGSALRRPGPRLVPAPLALTALLLGACASHPGPYYADDGPPERVPANLAATPDAVPRIEAVNPYANRPYSALGHDYTPDASDAPFEQRGVASWYGRRYHGQRTASGEPYDMFAMSAAHPTLPIPSYARVTNVHDGRSVVVRINDRGPFIQDRIIDLSYAAATRLGIAAAGSGEVIVKKLTATDIAAAGPAPATRHPVTSAAAVLAPSAALPVPAIAAPIAAPLPAAAAPLAPLASATTEPPSGPTGAAAADEPANDAGSGTPDTPPAGTPDAPEVPAAPEQAAASSPSTPPDPSTTSALSGPPAATATGRSSAPGGWSVQLGAFTVAANAEALRELSAGRLAALPAGALPAAARSVRIEHTDKFFRVLVGTPGERKAVQALARRLEKLLDHDTALYKP